MDPPGLRLPSVLSAVAHRPCCSLQKWSEKSIWNLPWRTFVLFTFSGNETSPESFLLHNALARKPKRIRTAFSPSQLLRLEHAFEKNHYVVGAERKQLAHSLSLTETQVRALSFSITLYSGDVLILFTNFHARLLGVRLFGALCWNSLYYICNY